MNSILIVEDSIEVQILLKRALGGLAYDLCLTSSAKEAKESLAKCDPSLILLDIGLPDQDGLEMFSEMQTDGRLKAIPVIFLTGNRSTSTQVAAFALGAEDYVIKPFNTLLLRARVEAKLKRASSHASTDQVLRKRHLQLESAIQRAYTLESGVPRAIHLTPLEFKLLFYLAKHEEQIFSRTQLINSVWVDSGGVFDRAVDTHISAIRKKLGSLAGYIESVPGLGYRFSSCPKSGQDS